MRRTLSMGLTLATLAILRMAVAPERLAAAPFRLANCTACTQYEAAVAGVPNGDFMAVWQGTTNTVEPTVFGHPYVAGGSLPVFPVDPAPALSPPQYEPDVAADAIGNYIAVWVASKDDLNTLIAQRLNPNGAPVGGPIEVSTAAIALPGSLAIVNPTVATTPSGGFVVGWVALPPSSAPAGSPPVVMAQRYGLNNQPVGAALTLSTGLVYGDRPSICVDRRNRIVATWTIADAFRPFEESKVGVVLRRFSPADVPFGPEIVIAPPIANAASTAVACGIHSNFAVAYSTTGSGSDLSDVFAQRFTVNGRPQGAAVQVNAQAAGSENRFPGIHFDPAGNFVVVWDATAPGQHQILAQRYAANGSRSGAPIRLSWDLGSTPAAPRLSALTGESFIVVWTLDQVGYGQELDFAAH